MYLSYSLRGIVPSCMASRKPRMDVSGERSSWLTLETKSRRVASRSLSWSAMLLKLTASCVASSVPLTGMRMLKSPLL